MPTPLTQLLPDVYPFAAYLGKRLDCKYIIGVGELAADNLIDFYPEFEVIGIVHASNVQAYRRQYEFGTWLSWDQQSSTGISLANHILERAIIVCTMAMDRLENSVQLLQMLKEWLDHAPVCLLTISENDLMRLSDTVTRLHEVHPGKSQLSEMECFLRAAGFNVEFIGLTATDNINYEKQTILAVMTNSRCSASAKQTGLKTPSDFRVVAFMAAYNEEDIIVNSIKNWTDQGVDVHLLENWSTDGTYELAKELEGSLPVTVERFPADAPSKYFDWSAMLARIEALAREIEADWFVRRGTDEVLMSPWPGLSYRDGLYLLDLADYNCVDHTVINFCPVDNEFKAGMDHEAHFQHFAFGKHLADFQQIKTWKNDGPPISMAESGGHDLKFAGRRLYPFKFLIKHYPVRSQKHGEIKIFRERMGRWNAEEKAKGWHNQYDQIEKDHSFVLSPSTLTTFDESEFCNTYLVERLSGVGVMRPARKIEPPLSLAVQELTLRLAERDAELRRIIDSFGWRLLSRYGKVKYRFLLPAYKAIGRVLRSTRGINDQGLAPIAGNLGLSGPTLNIIGNINGRSLMKVFSEIYHRRAWGKDCESVSGPGSSEERTAAFREHIAVLFKEFRIRSVLDAGCGDFNWMKHLSRDLEQYIGVDVVPELVSENQRQYANSTTIFLNADITRDKLKQADVILCRDCLIHLSFADIFAALHNFKQSGSRYLLTNTFISSERNTDVPSGEWHRLNLQLPPFNFPEPLTLIDEKCTHTGGIYADKRLALWALEDIPL